MTDPTDPTDPYAEARRAGPPDGAKPASRWRRGRDATDSAVRSAAAAKAVGARGRLPDSIPEGGAPPRAASGIPGLAALGRAATGQRPGVQGDQAALSDVRPFRVIESYPGSGVRPVGSSSGGVGESGHAGGVGLAPPAGAGGVGAGAVGAGAVGAGAGGGSGAPGGPGPAGGRGAERDEAAEPAGGPGGFPGSGTVRRVFPSATGDQPGAGGRLAGMGSGAVPAGMVPEGTDVPVGAGGAVGSFANMDRGPRARKMPGALAAGMTRPLKSGRAGGSMSWDGPSRGPGWRKPVATLLVLIVLGGIYVVVQAFRGVPRASLVVGTQTSMTIPGIPPVLPWPATGEAEVTVAGVGTFGPVGGDNPTAIGSVAKIMAAYVVLRDHPLTPGAQGPSITITTNDVATYQAELAQGDSVVPVTAGQTITELQALQALLVPSGDNIAVVLADWDAGSEAAFATKMTTQAAALGMTHTHYSDASGLLAGTVSTAADQLILAPQAMGDPVFAATVAMTQIELPTLNPLSNYNTLLGMDGIDGIKTGSTTSGNLVFSAKHTVNGHAERIYGAVLGVAPKPGQGYIPAATDASLLLVKAVEAAVKPLAVLPAGSVEAHVTAPWLSSPVPAVTASPVSALGVPGMTVQLSATRSGRLGKTTPSGAVVGQAVAVVGAQRTVVPLHTVARIPGPSLAWRLTRF